LVAVAADVITPGTSLQALLSLNDELLPPEYWGYFKAIINVSTDFDIPTVELPVKSHESTSTLLRASDRGCNRSISKVVSRLDQNCVMETKLNEWRKRQGEGKDIANRTCVALMLPRQGEVWDVGLKIRFANEQADFFLFIDSNSMKEIDNKQASGPRKFQDGHQYKQVKKVMGDRHFTYIYLTTYDIGSKVEGRCVTLGRTETKEFLGFVSEFYLALRVGVVSPKIS